MSRDLEMKSAAEQNPTMVAAVFACIDLYDSLRRQAEEGIADSRREKEAFEH
jgi:hypothetical protein